MENQKDPNVGKFATIHSLGEGNLLNNRSCTIVAPAMDVGPITKFYIVKILGYDFFTQNFYDVYPYEHLIMPEVCLKIWKTNLSPNE